MNCIVVPIYKELTQLTPLEQLSLNQLYKILGGHSIIFVGPENLKWTDYLDHAGNISINPVIRKFPDHFFESICGYNRLMISLDFLQAFKDYKFILIYQLDAFVFSDQFDFWCAKNYDYIGAPWNGLGIYLKKPLIGVGNGGFSLRHVGNSIKLLNDVRRINSLEPYKNFDTKNIIVRFPGILIKVFLSKYKLSNYEKNFSFYEDIFWSKAAKEYLRSFRCESFILKALIRLFIRNNFKIPNMEIATQFSFETCPSRLYKINKEKLPFGCHAWSKYEFEFWRAFIPLQ